MTRCIPRPRTALALALLLCTESALSRDTAGPERAATAEARPKATPNKSSDAAAASAPGAAAASTSSPTANPAASPVPSTAPSAPDPATRAAGDVAGGNTAPSTAPSSDAATPDAAAAERAKQLYERGAEAFTAQRNAEAIGYFRRAAELVPSAKLTYNIGLAYEEMGDAGRALAEYRTYLKQELAGERLEEVHRRMAALERRLAATGVQQLAVSSVPAGATLSIGGQTVGVTPWAGELAPGVHRVEISLPGHAPQAAEVTLAADHAAELSLPLTELPRPLPVAEPSGLARVSPLAWTFMGVGVGALTGGVAFEISRAHSSDRAAHADTEVAAAEARGAADSKQMASLLLLGFGAAFSIGGAVIAILDANAPNATGQPPSDDAKGPAAAFDVPCSPEFCGVLGRGRF